MRKMRKMNKKGISAALLVIALAAIIVVACIVGVWFILDMTREEEPEEPYYGTMTLTIAELSTFDRSAVSTTSAKYEVFSPSGVALDGAEESDFNNPKGGATLPNAVDVSINPEDEGYFWIRTYGGSAHFVDVEATDDANDRIEASTFIDVNSDNKLDVVFSVYVGDMGDPGQAQKVPVDLSVYLVPDDGGSVSVSSPSDKTMSNGTQTSSIEWELSGHSEKKGFEIARVYVKSNRTEEDLVHVTSVSVSYAPSDVNEVDPAPSYESGAKKWSVDLDVTDYRQAVYGITCARDTGEASKVGITVAFESYFASGTLAQVEITIYVELIKPASSFYTTLSDTVVVKN